MLKVIDKNARIDRHGHGNDGIVRGRPTCLSLDAHAVPCFRVGAENLISTTKRTRTSFCAKKMEGTTDLDVEEAENACWKMNARPVTLSSVLCTAIYMQFLARQLSNASMEVIHRMT